MTLKRIVATNTRVEFATAEVLDGEDIESAVIVGTLGSWCEIEAVDCWWRFLWW